MESSDLEKKCIKFVDFCAGIGGGRLGMLEAGLSSAGFSEIDMKASDTYRLFYGDSDCNYGDLMEINPDNLPDFDVLIAGFPCQTFSIVGKREGFEDYRGQVIYGLCKILKKKKVPYFILENVKGLVNHDKGRTFKKIINELSALGYCVKSMVLDSSDFGVPQMRERVYIVGYLKDNLKEDFNFPAAVPMKSLKNYLIDESDACLDVNDKTFQKYLNNKYNKGKFDINEILKQDYLVLDTRQSDLRLYKDKCPTLRTGRHGILYVKDGKLKKLSGFEALLLQGFPLELARKAKMAKIANNRLLSQAGNAMTVNVIQAIAKKLMECCK